MSIIKHAPSKEWYKMSKLDGPPRWMLTATRLIYFLEEKEEVNIGWIQNLLK